MNNEMWSQKPLIEELSETTEFCILDEATPKNKRINAKALLDAKANVSDLNNVNNTSDLNKPISAAQQTALDLKAPLHNPAFTGDATLNGEPISTNDLNGTNYVMVYGVGTPTENAAELQAVYNEAKKMPRYLGILSSSTPIQMYNGQTFGIFTGSYRYYKILVDGTYNPFNIPSNLQISKSEAEAKSVRTTIIVAPGEYNFGAAAFTVDAPSINIVSLTGNSDVIISSTETYYDYNTIYGIKITTNDVLIKGINCKTNAFYIATSLNNLICEYCTGGSFSFGSNGGTASGTFNNCTGGASSFGGNGGTASGTFNNCTGGAFSFGGNGGTASGTFNNCTGGSSSFGRSGTASGTFNNCTGGANSFGAYGTASGTFNNCTDGANSFGAYGTASGTFNNCTGGANSFGAYGTASGTFINCKLTSGTFRTPTGEGKIYNSIDGNGNLINTPLPIFADNAAAASLAVGTMYRTDTGIQMIRF